MRQWMVNPRILCRQHLLGEHQEVHAFIGALEKGRIKPGQFKGMLTTYHLRTRHNELVSEMVNRGWTGHATPIDLDWFRTRPWFWLSIESDADQSINVKANEAELWRRCHRCRNRMVVLGYRFPVRLNSSERFASLLSLPEGLSYSTFGL
jgi:hypothetical protein